MGWRGPMTHRQFLAFHDWIVNQGNEPTRTDYYIMALTQQVELFRAAWGGEEHPRLNLNEYRLPLSLRRVKLSPEEKIEDDIPDGPNHPLSKKAGLNLRMMAAARFGPDVKVVMKPRSEINNTFWDE